MTDNKLTENKQFSTAIIGDEEATANEISLKPLLQAGEQKRCKLSEIANFIRS